MNKSRILLIGNFLSHHGGSRGVCEELADRLRADGWTVLTTSSYKNRLFRLVDMMSTAWLKRNSYDVTQVDVYSGSAFLWAEAICRMLRCANKPYILTLHGGNLPAFAASNPNRVKKLLASAATVTTPSNYLLETMQVYRHDIHILKNAIDLSNYKHRERVSVIPKLIWLRAIHQIYNPTLAIKVLALLVQEFPEITLQMIGPDKRDGSLRNLENLIISQDLAKHVKLVGGIPKSDVPKYLDMGDIFINTTNIDNTPVSVIEAMACGLCVVSTNVGGIPYLLEDEVDALLVPPDDPEAMATAIRRILIEPGLAKKLSRNARSKAEQFDWVEILPQWEKLLTETSGM